MKKYSRKDCVVHPLVTLENRREAVADGWIQATLNRGQDVRGINVNLVMPLIFTPHSGRLLGSMVRCAANPPFIYQEGPTEPVFPTPGHRMAWYARKARLEGSGTTFQVIGTNLVYEYPTPPTPAPNVGVQWR